MTLAALAELVDASDSKSDGGNSVGVRVPQAAHIPQSPFLRLILKREFARNSLHFRISTESGPSSPLFYFLMDVRRASALIVPVVDPLGYELVDIKFVTEHGRRILRVFIDREGGVSVGDCEKISRELETLLEVEGVLGDRSVLEVSSPGLNRPLTKEAHFVRSIGKMAAITTTKAPEEYGDRRNYKGMLLRVENGKVVIEVDRKEYHVPLSLIEKAHLVYQVGGK